MPGECCPPLRPRVEYNADFDPETARKDLLEYRQRGPDGTTRRLVDALVEAGVQDATLLDIGGGVGAVQLELLAAGVARSLDVDGSEAYLEAAQQEAEARGLADRTAYRHGDFCELAGEVEPADVVTLHRVLCCYPDVEMLVGTSVARARRLYGLVYPVDRWWTRIAFRLGNLVCAITRNPFRIHVHPTALVDRLVREAGFARRYQHAGWIWQTAVYVREAAR